MQIKTYSALESQTLAKALLNQLSGGAFIRLEGRLGSGKTTFTQGLGRALGIKRAVKSPTYTIVKNYPVKEDSTIKELVHIDAYRLEDGGADTVDIESFYNSDSLVVMEWAQFVEDYLPEKYLLLEIETIDDSTRLINLSCVGGFEIDEDKLVEDYNKLLTEI